MQRPQRSASRAIPPRQIVNRTRRKHPRTRRIKNTKQDHRRGRGRHRRNHSISRRTKHVLTMQIAKHTQSRDHNPEERSNYPDPKRYPAPDLRVVRRGLRSGIVPGLQFPIHLRSVNNCRNSRRQAAKYRGQNREHKMIRHSRPERRHHGTRNRQRSRCDGRQQISPTLHAYGRVIGITRTTLRTKHKFPRESLLSA